MANMNMGVQSSGHSSKLVQHDFLNSSGHNIQAWTFDFWFGRKGPNFMAVYVQISIVHF